VSPPPTRVNLFGVPVDVVPQDNVKPRVRASIERDLVPPLLDQQPTIAVVAGRCHV